MDFDLTLYVGILSVSAILSLGLGLYAWNHRAMPGAIPFTVLLWDACLWAVANALEMAGTTLPGKLFWANLQYLCYTSIPVLWLVLALRFTGRERFLTVSRLALLCLIPALTFGLVWTNPAHELMRRNVTLDFAGPFPVIAKTYGPWAYIHFAYSYLLMLAAALVFLKAARARDRVFRGQAIILLCSLIVPFLWNLLYVTGLSPVKRHDIAPAVLSLVGLFASWGLFRFRMFDVLPVAHDAVLNSISDGVIVLNNQNEVVAINPVAQRILRLPASSAIGRPALQVFRPWPQLTQVIQKTQESQVEFTLQQTAPVPRYYDLALSPLVDYFNRFIGHLIIFHDVTERKRVEEKLFSLSQTDPLTGLANRRHFFEALDQEIPRSRRYNSPLSVIMIDVNKMKSINDRFGHQAGDEALKKVAEQIQAMRQTDIAARIGGDEFALLLPSTDRAGAEKLAWRLLESVKAIRLEGDTPVSISLGIAEIGEEDGGQGEALMARADQAMYRAKQDGLGCVVA
jgi:diguanylate cyclase (GGDEF)-like protein/PAS domain S-box-containing protein